MGGRGPRPRRGPAAAADGGSRRLVSAAVDKSSTGASPGYVTAQQPGPAARARALRYPRPQAGARTRTARGPGPGCLLATRAPVSTAAAGAIQGALHLRLYGYTCIGVRL